MKGLVATALGATLMIGASSAGAVPLANLDGASSPNVTLVYGGCGPYGHRGPWGGCRPGGQWSGGYWRGGYWGGAYYAAGVCPPGYHLGPQGRLCWPN
jgi:hypothetical protein